MLGVRVPRPQRHRVSRASGRKRSPGAGFPALAAALSEADLGSLPARRRARETGRGDRAIEKGRRPLPHGGRQLDEQYLLGARLRPPPRPDGEGQFALLRESYPAGNSNARTALPQRALSSALLANELLPVLGLRHLDRLR